MQIRAGLLLWNFDSSRTQLCDEGQIKGLVLVFTSKRWLTEVWSFQLNIVLLESASPSRPISDATLINSWQGRAGSASIFPHLKGNMTCEMQQLRVPCSEGSSWTSRRSSAEPSGGYTKWQPLCWHGYKKGSSLGCYHPLQNTRKWWTTGILQGQGVPASTPPSLQAHSHCRSDLALWWNRLNTSLATVLRAWPLPSQTLTFCAGSINSNKDICHSGDRGSTSMLRVRRGQHDHTAQDAAGLQFPPNVSIS